jgi:hypothetical protein
MTNQTTPNLEFYLLLEEGEKVYGKHKAADSFQLDFYPENEYGPAYYNFNELDKKAKPHFGFSSPNFESFKKDFLYCLKEECKRVGNLYKFS